MNRRDVNADTPIGTAVIYRSSRPSGFYDIGEKIFTRTRSKPWRLAHGAAVVLVDGREGAVALFALELADDQLELFAGRP